MDTGKIGGFSHRERKKFFPRKTRKNTKYFATDLHGFSRKKIDNIINRRERREHRVKREYNLLLIS
jgi:hypothetical protein